MTLLDWALPGLGFMLAGRWARGASQALIVLVTFAIGLALRGGVMWPTWSASGHQELNLINNITFIIQMGAGLPALASLIAHESGYSLLGGVPEHPFYELGSFFIVVAGALNYYAACNFHDRLVTVAPRYEEQERSPVAS